MFTSYFTTMRMILGKISLINMFLWPICIFDIHDWLWNRHVEWCQGRLQEPCSKLKKLYAFLNLFIEVVFLFSCRYLKRGLNTTYADICFILNLTTELQQNYNGSYQRKYYNYFSNYNNYSVLNCSDIMSKLLSFNNTVRYLYIYK